jgi:pyruvate dehydrogenase E2 component (dihydrolipoamide acetyltransferase)
MALQIIMPKQGQTVESCIVSKWYKKKGDTVQKGDLLFAYETDKASFEEFSQVDGTILDIFFDEGDDVPVLTNMCVIGNVGEHVDVFDPKKIIREKENTSTTLIKEEKQPEPTIARDNHVEEIRISPRAKKLALRLGVNYHLANPSGPYGRIIERDILTLEKQGIIATRSARAEFLNSVSSLSGTGLGGRITTSDLDGRKANADEGDDYTEIKTSNIRKAIAKAMLHSLSTTAQLTLNASFDATGILEYRKRIKESGGKPADITLNDMILFAVTRSLIKFKELNAHYLEDTIRQFHGVHLGIAVDTGRGLMVPTIFNADKKTIEEISWESRELSTACRSGKISPDLLKGASFSVTNLGSLGIESFTPVLNPPQTGILGVNTIVHRMKILVGYPFYYPAITLSLTFDHRALDGAAAAKFLSDLKNGLEDFTRLYVK